jgi:hypothetical protein
MVFMADDDGRRRTTVWLLTFISGRPPSSCITTAIRIDDAHVLVGLLVACLSGAVADVLPLLAARSSAGSEKC